MSALGDASLVAATSRSDAPASAGPSEARRRFTTAALIGGGIAAVPFLWVLWNGRLDPLRTASPERNFTNFYDLQARALFGGHWWVPKGSLGIEAFVVGGHHYTYFPPFPSLLRMPILAVTDSLDGRLTAPSLLLAWVVTMVFSVCLLWRVRLLMRGPAAIGRGEGVAVSALVATIGSGSVLLYLAALPWVYHEAFAWGIAAAVGALFALLGVLERPSAGRVVATGALATAATLSRTTIGWGCVIAVLIAAVWFAVGRGGAAGRRWWLPVLAAGLVPLVAGFMITGLKFGTPFMHPLGSQVWTRINEHRREALAANGGSLLGLDFLPSTALAYLRPDGLRLTPIFPFITLPSVPARAVGGAFLDQTYRTASLPASMPLLFMLSLWGLVTAFRPNALARARLIRIPLVGAMAGTGGVLFYGYISNRYLGDFVPLLIVASGVGLVDVWRRLERRRRGARVVALGGLIALAAFGVLANFAVATTTEQLASGLDQAQSYVRLQQSISDETGHPLDGVVSRTRQLPGLAPVDQLFVVGDCDGMYLSTGEIWDPWIPVALRGVELAVRFPGSVKDLGRVRLVTVGDGQKDPTSPSSSVSVEGDGAGRVRFRVDIPYLPITGKWMRVEPGHTSRVKVTPTGGLHQFAVDVDGHRFTVVPQSALNADEHDVDHLPVATPAHSPLVEVTTVRVPRPSLCRSLTEREAFGPPLAP